MATKAPITDLAKEWLRLDKVRFYAFVFLFFFFFSDSTCKESQTEAREREREFTPYANRRLTLFNDVYTLTHGNGYTTNHAEP
jgi:hypothetical protein